MQEVSKNYCVPSFADDVELYNSVQVSDEFLGPKISVMDLIGKQIVFIDYVIIESHFKRYGDEICKVQIELNDEKRIFFTSSKNIRKTLEVFKDKLPRVGTIERDDRSLKIV